MTTYINTDQSGTYSIGSADTYVFGPNIIQTIDSPSAAAVSVQIGVTGRRRIGMSTRARRRTVRA